MELKQKLLELIVGKSLRVADEPVFELASGKKSRIYIDGKKTTCNAVGKTLIGELLFQRIAPLGVTAIGGLTLGADPIAAAVAYASALKGQPVNAFIVRKDRKDHGLKQVIEGDVQPGQRVVIVDDVVTTGASTIEAIRKARAFGLEVVKVIALVDRQEGGRENILREGVEFEAVITKKELLDAYNRRHSSG